MASIEDVGISAHGGAQPDRRGPRTPEPVTVAEMSASAFRVARVDALRGRYLLPEDEAPGAAGRRS